MTLAYKKMFLDVTLEAVDKGHFTFLYVPSPLGSFFMPFLQIFVYRCVANSKNLPNNMSFRASAHTGVGIRIP